MYSLRLSIRILPALLLLGGAQAGVTQGGSAPDQSAASAPVAAHWETRKISFTYMGIGTKYSCDGMESAVRALLLVVGARKQDLDIRASGCVHGSGHPEPFPGVQGTFAVLVPDTTQPPAANAVSARWQSVDVVRDRGLTVYTESLNGGDCELLEQFHKAILPLFSTRDVRYRSSCFPHTATLGAITLKLQVLKPLPAAPAASAPAPAAS